MDIIIKKKEETNISYEQIINLIHESFEERLNQGLQFTCSFMTAEDFEKRNTDGIVLVAIDNKTNDLIGTATIHIKTDEHGILYGYSEYLAISSKKKRCGIGTLLDKECERICKKAKCEYIMCDTATEAKSSVKYHLKMGFKIVGLESYSSTNYFSYLFRKQLNKNSKWSSQIYCKFAYIKSFLRVKLLLKKNGSKTFLCKWYETCLKR